MISVIFHFAALLLLRIRNPNTECERGERFARFFEAKIFIIFWMRLKIAMAVEKAVMNIIAGALMNEPGNKKAINGCVPRCTAGVESVCDSNGNPHRRSHPGGSCQAHLHYIIAASASVKLNNKSNIITIAKITNCGDLEKIKTVRSLSYINSNNDFI